MPMALRTAQITAVIAKAPKRMHATVAHPGEAYVARKRKGEGQTALVTGASMGIGVDLAECFAKDGYDLILAARSESALNDVANKLAEKYKIKATPIALDL